MEWVMTYLAAIALHEGGHVLAGWLMGLRAKCLVLLWPANGWEVARWRWGATTVVIGWLPLGGGVLWEGQGLPAPPPSHSPGYEGLRRWQKAVVIMGGVAANGTVVGALCLAASGWPPDGWASAMAWCNAVLAGLQLLPSSGNDGALLRRLLISGN